MNGSTAGVMKENGTTMICKDQGFTNGMMGAFMMESGRMTNNTEKAHILTEIIK